MLFVGGWLLWGEYDCYLNKEAMQNMNNAIPAVVSIDGTKKLNEEMQIISRAKDMYFGRCEIPEKSDEKEIVKHYKREFQKNGWEYRGRCHTKEIYPKSDSDEWYYYFEKEGLYCIYLCLTMDQFERYKKYHHYEFMDGIHCIFHIGLKSKDQGWKYCKIKQEFLELGIDENGLFDEAGDNLYNIERIAGDEYLSAKRSYAVDEDVLVSKIIEIAEKKGWTLSKSTYNKDKIKNSNIKFYKQNLILRVRLVKNQTVEIGITSCVTGDGSD